MLSPSEFAKLMRETPTDKEAIETFTPQEVEFHRWYVTNRTPGLDISSRDWVQKAWPNVENAYEKWMIFYKKWICRPHRQGGVSYEISEDDYIDVICSMPCNNHEQYDKAVEVQAYCDPRFINLGENSFGGALTGYMVNAGFPSLLAKFQDDDDTDLLRYRICSIDLDSNRYRYSAKDSGSFTRGTDITDFLDRDPFCFWQMGGLKCCSGNTWKDIRKGGVANTNPNPSLRPDLDQWDETDYVVVVQLDPNGCPSGSVYVVHEKEFEDNTRYDPDTRPELPGPLDKWSKPPFFMAKIADKFQDLKKTRQFDFQVIFKEIQDVVPVKFAGTPQRPIPSYITKWYPPLSLSNVEGYAECFDRV
ncbi:hypothetical protein EDB80DRAFT_881672 [Ilyonectria destructans]|nr:hypothetical protein EDB80DRAFT_881672 [Ilyonectria destructans]